MKLTIQTTTMPGARLEGENPHPRFRSLTQNQACVDDGSLTAFQQQHYGEACGERTLPYRMQDRYGRGEAAVQVKTAVLENEHLIATFTPEYGGKLWSLFDKDENREILFSNEVVRPANLAIRNAWTCGGIEWNLGHTGHSAFTCQTLHCAAMKDADGADFLRMYEYEATEGQILQLDMHLPSGSRQLIVHVRIENTRNVDAPVYWWTNTAVPLTEQTRVFSATDEILFQLPYDFEKRIVGFGRGKMPHQPNLGDIDISYPWRIPFSVEYFFQNPHADLLPWEVAVEENGTGFGERSTQPLFARKMFCWGTGTGGRHWCDYLARPGKGDYVEIQAGLAPTQHHTAMLPARGVISFTQLIGAFTAPGSVSKGDWLSAQAVVAQAMEETISTQTVQQAHERCETLAQKRTPELFLVGTAYGGLECEKRKLHGETAFAQHLLFPLPQIGDDTYPWLCLLRGKDFPAAQMPAAYLTDPDWIPLAQPILGESRETAVTVSVWRDVS